MADLQRKNTAVGSHGVVQILHVHGAAPRVRFEERPPAHHTTPGPPPPQRRLGEDEPEVDPDVVLSQHDQSHALQAPSVAGLL